VDTNSGLVAITAAPGVTPKKLPLGLFHTFEDDTAIEAASLRNTP